MYQNINFPGWKTPTSRYYIKYIRVTVKEMKKTYSYCVGNNWPHEEHDTRHRTRRVTFNGSQLFHSGIFTLPVWWRIQILRLDWNVFIDIEVCFVPAHHFSPAILYTKMSPYFIIYLKSHHSAHWCHCTEKVMHTREINTMTT